MRFSHGQFGGRKMKLYIMRHGETDWNKEKRLQGQSDIDLNEFGRKLAYKTKEGLKEVPFDLVITSPLKRARETALIVKGDREIPIIEDARIEEMCFGEYEGLYCKGEKFNIPDEEFKNFFDAPERYRATRGGENFSEFNERIEHFLDDVFNNKDYQNDTILVSVHGAVLCAILRIIKKNPMRLFWGSGVHKNCAITIIHVENGIPTIEKENIVYYEDEVAEW